MELKAYKGDIYVPMYGSIADAKVYLKSEADKVIAELKALKAQAEDDCAYWKMCHRNAENAMHETEEVCMYLTKSERHQKYKRCLAMAKWCEMGISYWDDDEQEGGWEYKKLRHCIRWKKRWLELAEKFKPNKSTAKYGKGSKMENEKKTPVDCLPEFLRDLLEIETNTRLSAEGRG